MRPIALNHRKCLKKPLKGGIKYMAKKAKMDNQMQGHWEMHKKMMGWKMLILGLLVLANSTWGIVNWANFIGGIIAIGGLAKLVMPCKCCK